jgi:cobalt-zinc-cadmium resistance protein CzcA
MIKNLISWALHSRLVVILLAMALLIFGIYSFRAVNVEAYPDPAPPIVEVVAQYPGASAEEIERQVTIPLEVALAGMPGLKYTRTQSMFELCHIRNQFDYSVEDQAAKQEVINRLQFVQLPPGVIPQISPESPTGEVFRYVLVNPKDSQGRPIYSLNDLKSLQDWTLERLLRRVPRIIDVASYGGTVKRYEIQPDPARLQRYGITLAQLKNAITNSNANIGAEYIFKGETVQVVRSLGLIGQGEDPMDNAMVMTDPIAARNYLRRDELRRIREIRQIVLATADNVPIRVDDVVAGGPVRNGEETGKQGVIVSHQTRLGRAMFSVPEKDARGREIVDARGNRIWDEDGDVIQGIVLLRKGEDTLPALRDVNALIDELNHTPGRLLPGVQILPYADRTQLIHVTTETVRENLLVGMGLVIVVLLMFLGNVRSALIVAINVPLALLFAFAVLFLRGKSANLLSIGAVDFGIIVDSSVIMVENIYRHLTSGLDGKLPIVERIVQASGEIQRSLVFSTLIMVCAFLPLFTMAGPEGKIFGPMADTYAFALGGALLLAVTLSPVLCSLLLGRLQPKPESFLVRWMQSSYLRGLQRALRHRWIVMAACGGMVAVTAMIAPWLGREFMPELDEGNIWIQATLPMKSSLDESCQRCMVATDIMKRYPEVELLLCQVGRPDDGTDPSNFFNAEFYLPLKPVSQWPILPGHTRRRSKQEIIDALDRELSHVMLGVDWNISQNIRNMVMESLSGVRGENSVKIIGPDLAGLERVADKVSKALGGVPGVFDVGVYHIMGQSNLTFPIDRGKCAQWGVSVADAQDVIATAVGGKALNQMIEGERSFDITLRWPAALRADEEAILNIPLEVPNNSVTSSPTPTLGTTLLGGGASGPSTIGSSTNMPALVGSASGGALNDLTRTPHRRLGDVITPLNSAGRAGGEASLVQPGASDIYRDQGQRLIAIKFDVRGRDLAGAVADAQRKVAPLIAPPYRVEWAGEFHEMHEAEGRLLIVIPLSIALVAILLYMTFRSLTDIVLVLSNVVTMVCGGIWALLLTHTVFSISAAVGFISIFGVAVMDAILQVSSFHRARLEGKPMEEAVVHGSMLRLRPIMMTALTAIFGLMPAALSTRIGAQTQRPLAIVVMGGMIVALAVNRYLTPVLYSVLRKAPPAPDAGGVAH